MTKRFDEVTDMQRSLDLKALVRRLDLKRKVPNQLLDAHEVAFLDAMKLRSEDTVAAKEKMQQWRNVFEGDADADEDRKQMELLIRHEMKRLTKVGPKIGDNPQRVNCWRKFAIAKNFPTLNAAQFWKESSTCTKTNRGRRLPWNLPSSN